MRRCAGGAGLNVIMAPGTGSLVPARTRVPSIEVLFACCREKPLGPAHRLTMAVMIPTARFRTFIRVSTEIHIAKIARCQKCFIRFV